MARLLKVPRKPARNTTAPYAGPEAHVVRHVDAMYLLASVLTPDPEHAERLVVQAIKAKGDDVCEFRQLAAAVHVAWSAWGSPLEPSKSPMPSGGSASAQVMRDLHGLPDDQRSAIALCRFGGHDYRQAADALGLPAPELAVLLGQALRALAPSSADPRQARGA